MQADDFAAGMPESAAAVVDADGAEADADAVVGGVAVDVAVAVAGTGVTGGTAVSSRGGAGGGVVVHAAEPSTSEPATNEATNEGRRAAAIFMACRKLSRTT